MAPQDEYEGQTVMITGAAAGLGEALARRYGDEGANLVLVDNDADRVVEVGDELKASGAGVLACPTDVTVTAEVEDAVAQARTAFGGIDILIAAAGGYTASKPAEEVSDEEWETGIAVNLSGAFRVARAVIPSMKEAGRGRMVFFSSAAGRMPTPAGKGITYYAASKAGILGLARHLAVELGPFGINVNVVAPGTTLTARVAALRPQEEFDRIAQQVPLRRIGSVEDQVGPVMFLTSKASAYMNGATLDVNGGRIML